MKCKWIEITVLVVYVCTLIEGTEVDPTVMMETLPGYAVASGIELLNATRCRTEMEQFRDAVDHRVLWALSMLDTSGRPSSGYVRGNNFWTGHRPQCDSMNRKLPFLYSPATTRKYARYRNPAEEFPPFEVNFFGVYIRENSTIQYRALLHIEDIIVLGLCLPASCTEFEVTTMMTKILDDRLLLDHRLYSIDLELIRVSNLKIDYTLFFSAKIIMIIIILVALLGLVIAGTLYDIFVIQKQLEKNKEYSIDQSKVTEKIELDTDVEKKISHDQENTLVRELTPVSRSGEMLACFSFYSNFKQIFDTSDTSQDIRLIHGLRFFGTVWVIVAHVIVYKSNISNPAQTFFDLSLIPNQIFTNALLAVESFHFLGGFILTFGYLKQRKARSLRGHAFDFVNAVIKRYTRLTPAYIVTILLVIVLLTYLTNTSLLFVTEPAHELCSKYWWTNILYINNFYKWDELCMSWTWYLGNDMQLFIFGTILLMVSTNYYYTSMSLSVTVIIATTLYRAYRTYVTEYVPSLDMRFATLSTMYIPVWMRVQPYLIGMGTSLLLDKLNYKLRLSKKVLAICWSISILCNCSVIFSVPSVSKSTDAAVVYETFFKVCWSLGLMWIFVVCLTNNAGIINQFLSLPYWIPFSRVSLPAYLINPVVIFCMDLIGSYAYNAEMLETVVLASGQFIITYFAAFILSAICEVPVILLLRQYSSSRIKR